MKKLKYFLIMLGGLGLIYIVLLYRSGTDGGVLQNLSIRLPIPVVDGAFAALYLAQDKGFWEQEGLSVSLEPGSSELNPVSMVLQGVDEIGIAGGPELRMTARDKGGEILAFLLLHKNSNFPTILVPYESSIQSVYDLTDKNIGFFYGHISTDIIRSLLDKENIYVNEVDVGFDYSRLINGQIDAQWAFRPTAGINLPARGFKVREISPADYGINTHGYTFMVSETFNSNNSDVVQKFTNGLLKAVQYALDNPQEAIEATLKRSTTLNYDIVAQQITIYHEAIKNNNPIGFIDGDLLVSTKNRLVQLGLLSEKINIHDGIDAQYVNNYYLNSNK